MDLLSSLAKGSSGDNQPKPTSDNNPDLKPTDSADLLGSAKVVAEAAQAQFRGETDKFDKAKVAGASADLLDAGSQYGKLDDKQGVGKYVDQAEDYLRKYNTTTTQTSTTTTAPAPVEEKTAPAPTGEAATEAEKPAAASGDGGAGDYVKMAEGFLNKGSEGGESGGAGDMMKMAGGFLKK